MTTFVLTEKNVPVGATSSLQAANQWAGMAKGNDWYRFELDQLEHLGFPANGPAFDPTPVLEFQMPVMPTLDPDDPASAIASLSAYLHEVTDAMGVALHAA